jgi:hypothetical protein
VPLIARSCVASFNIKRVPTPDGYSHSQDRGCPLPACRHIHRPALESYVPLPFTALSTTDAVFTRVLHDLAQRLFDGVAQDADADRLVFVRTFEFLVRLLRADQRDAAGQLDRAFRDFLLL